MFFSSIDHRSTSKYRLLLDAAAFADEAGLCAVWTPERHFHEFGGLFPNPSVISAALAMVTKRLQLRSGSLISPLHNPVRIAEDWAIVDNLSSGRVAISFGSGWNVDDFIFFPERYDQRKTIMWQQIEVIKKLWRGRPVVQKNSYGKEVKISIYPRPIQKNLPVWITSGGNAGTFINAGMIGAHVLTHIVPGQSLETLASNIKQYRESLELNSFDPSQGKVAVMLHTFIGSDRDVIRTQVYEPFRAYLRSSVSLESKAAVGGGLVTGGQAFSPTELSADTVDDLLHTSVQWYMQHNALVGTIADCQQIVHQLERIGVNEIACLIDFVDDYDLVMESLRYLAQLNTVC